jgi:ubiquinone/menaquinone biosynthesis C-methylase UbiE
MQAEHAHHHPQGPWFETLYAVSMLFGRGGMARAVTKLAELSNHDVVVDVGCGAGVAARRARRDGAARVMGIDPSQRMLRLARWITSFRRMDAIGYKEGSAEHLPLGTASATVVWAIQSVHHWADRGQGCTEILRVLAPGGRLILAERSVTPGARGRASHGLTEREADELARLVANAGFTDGERRFVRVGRRNLVVIGAIAPAS